MHVLSVSVQIWHLKVDTYTLLHRDTIQIHFVHVACKIAE